jgi:DNA-binding response OmpR family regulator
MGDLILDPPTRQATRGGRRIELTSKEFALLEYLMRNPGHVLTRTMIEAHVWEHDFESGTNIVDVHINHLRSKIDKGCGRRLIETIWGAGYRLAGC